jgi:hypothetical protein
VQLKHIGAEIDVIEQHQHKEHRLQRELDKVTDDNTQRYNEAWEINFSKNTGIGYKHICRFV